MLPLRLPLALCPLANQPLPGVAGRHCPRRVAPLPPPQALLSAGATLRGLTVMDELAYSLAGENAHYGTPLNPADPRRIPGGSSSGSAVAAAAGHVHFALGTDTGGSVRVPAAHCGLYGYRPTWGRISTSGVRPLAPSFDTVGVLATSPGVMRAVASVLLQTGDAAAAAAAAAGASSDSAQRRRPFTRWLVAADAFDLCTPGVAAALYGPLAAAVADVSRLLGSSPQEVRLAEGVTLLPGGGAHSSSSSSSSSLRQWMEVFRVAQAGEVWQALGGWVSSHDARFGPGVAQRFAMAAGITPQQLEEARAKQAAIREHLHSMLLGGAVLMFPTAPGPAPLRGHADDSWRISAISLTCIAGLSGLPQVTLPLAALDGGPLGLSLVGGPGGSDEDLLAAAEELSGLLRLPNAAS